MIFSLLVFGPLLYDFLKSQAVFTLFISIFTVLQQVFFVIWKTTFISFLFSTLIMKEYQFRQISFANSAQTEYCSRTLLAFPLTLWDPVGLLLDPLGPCRPTSLPPGTLQAYPLTSQTLQSTPWLSGTLYAFLLISWDSGGQLLDWLGPCRPTSCPLGHCRPTP